MSVLHGDQQMDPLFVVVEAEINGRCNRRCSYCPVSVVPYPEGVPRLMPDAVFERLLLELERLRFVGRFSHHFLNEPLLRADLESLARRLKEAVPEAEQILYTNGDLLTEDRYRSLLDSGIDEIVVTSHSGRYHPARPRQQVHFPEEMTLSNRGGFLQQMRTATEYELALPCYAPSEMLIVGANGDVLLCHEDADRSHVFGNLLDSPLDEIWHSAAFSRMRQTLKAGRRGAAAICAACTNFDLTQPGRSSGMWKPEVWAGEA